MPGPVRHAGILLCMLCILLFLGANMELNDKTFTEFTAKFQGLREDRDHDRAVGDLRHSEVVFVPVQRVSHDPWTSLACVYGVGENILHSFMTSSLLRLCFWRLLLFEHIWECQLSMESWSSAICGFLPRPTDLDHFDHPFWISLIWWTLERFREAWP